jgi:hypothetical protein
VDAFSRNLVMVLFGCAMLLCLGLVGMLGPEFEAGPGLDRFMTGPAPVWLAAVGAVGIGAVIALVLAGATETGAAEAGKKGDALAAAPASAPEGGEADEAPATEAIADATLTLVEIEVLLRREDGAETPALGAAVPPAVICKALYEARARWMTAGLKHGFQDSLAAAKSPFTEAAARIAQAVPVRGREDGESVSYRVAALVHVPPMASLEDPEQAMETLGRLHGDRFIEIAMVRVPEEAGTFAAALTVAGPLAAEKLAGESADPAGSD